MFKNLISIITPLYNSETFIKDTINSVLKQTYENWEMIIVDDCSIDQGFKIVQDFTIKDKRIKLIQLKENSGGAIARNTAIKEAKGRYIAFLDSDDLWHPQKLEKQVKFMEDNDYAFTFTKYQHMSEDGHSLNKCVKALNKLSYKKALFTNYIGCLSAMYDVEKLGKVYMPLIRKRQDYGLWLKILKKVEYGYGLDENLAYYRVRKNSISSNKMDLIKYQWKLYREIENLSIFSSLFYMSYTVMLKMLKIK